MLCVIFKYRLITSTDDKCILLSGASRRRCFIGMFLCHSAGGPQKETMLCVDAVTLMTALDRLDTQLNQIQVAQPFTNKCNLHNFGGFLKHNYMFTKPVVCVFLTEKKHEADTTVGPLLTLPRSHWIGRLSVHR